MGNAKRLTPTLAIMAQLADLCLDSFVRGNTFWEGEHVRLVLRFKSMPIECFNRYEPLAQLNYSNEAVSSSSNCDKQNGNVYICRCGFSG